MFTGLKLPSPILFFKKCKRSIIILILQMRKTKAPWSPATCSRSTSNFGKTVLTTKVLRNQPNVSSLCQNSKFNMLRMQVTGHRLMSSFFLPSLERHFFELKLISTCASLENGATLVYLLAAAAFQLHLSEVLLFLCHLGVEGNLTLKRGLLCFIEGYQRING